MKITMFLQIICALSLVNVWIVRNKKSTLYRGGDAKNLKEEFIAYGLPVWFYYLIGFLKITSALLLIVGISQPILILPTASLVLVLMLGAISMHFKVKDNFVKCLPAISMFSLCLAIILSSIYL